MTSGTDNTGIEGEKIMNLEIEKKFLITGIPGDVDSYRHYEIEQGYICTSPTVRIRKRDNEYFLTVKSKPVNGIKPSETLINDEYEINISKEAYEHLLQKVDSTPLSKTRYLVPLDGGLTAEVDVFRGRLSGLQFAEVEFPTAEAAEHFKKPSWFVKDVSSDKRYRNSYLAGLKEYNEEEFL